MSAGCSVQPAFLTPLDVRQIDDRRWEILADLQFRSDICRCLFVVPAGFCTDFASVPRAPLAYLLFGGRGNAAAVVHDYLYQIHLPDVGKAIADQVFREALGAMRYSASVCWTMYQAVSLFGQSAFDSGPTRYKVLNPRGMN